MIEPHHQTKLQKTIMYWCADSDQHRPLSASIFVNTVVSKLMEDESWVVSEGILLR
jgi:hypothetical protein